MRENVDPTFGAVIMVDLTRDQSAMKQCSPSWYRRHRRSPLPGSHPDVRLQAASSLLKMELNDVDSKALQSAIEHDDALWKLAVPIALEHKHPRLVDLMSRKNRSQRRFLVQSLKDAVSDADDSRLRMLIDSDGSSNVARCLVGRNEPKSDELPHELLLSLIHIRRCRRRG